MNLTVPTPGGLTAKAPVGRSEYGRVKVALPRGKGLLDWIQKSNGKNLASTRLAKVTAEELVKHNKREDCWMVLFGQVYDVTPYLEYHPGGVPELMRAAGTDATVLFNQYHSWVNYDSMLKACLVGRFEGDTAKLPPPGPSTLDGEEGAASGGDRRLSISGDKGEMTALAHSTLDSHNISLSAPSPSTLLLSCPAHWTRKTMKRQCVSYDVGETHLRLLVKTLDGRAPLELKWDPIPTALRAAPALLRVRVEEEEDRAENTRIRLDFGREPTADEMEEGEREEEEEGIASQMIGGRCMVKERPPLAFHPARVLRCLRHSSLPSTSRDDLEEEEEEEEGAEGEGERGDRGEGLEKMRESLPRDCLLLLVECDASAAVRVPVGHHVEVRVRKGGSQVARPYTPIPMTDAIRACIGRGKEILDSYHSGRLLCFLIKVYDDGVVTPAIERLKRDDTVHISDPIGTIDFSCLPFTSTHPKHSSSSSFPLSRRSTTDSSPSPTTMTVTTTLVTSTSNRAAVAAAAAAAAAAGEALQDPSKRVVCLAAGSGITPMMGLIEERGWERCKLVAYNRTVSDIPRGEWIPAYAESTVDRRLVHVLSAVGEGGTWKGARGRIGRENVGELVGNELVFVCGPDGFVQAAATLLHELGHPTDLVHIFQG